MVLYRLGVLPRKEHTAGGGRLTRLRHLYRGYPMTRPQNGTPMGRFYG